MRRTTANRLRRFRFSAGQLHGAAGDNSTPYFFFPWSICIAVENLADLQYKTVWVHEHGRSFFFRCQYHARERDGNKRSDISLPTCFLSQFHVSIAFSRGCCTDLNLFLDSTQERLTKTHAQVVRSCKISGWSGNKLSGQLELEMNWLHRNERVTSKLTQRPTAQNTLNLKVKIMQGAYDRHPKVPHELACNQSLIQRNARYAILLLKQPQQQNIKAVPTYEPFCYHDTH